ncbi:hypothetical protein NPIL_542431, partial [Nephila pilipes]
PQDGLTNSNERQNQENQNGYSSNIGARGVLQDNETDKNGPGDEKERQIQENKPRISAEEANGDQGNKFLKYVDKKIWNQISICWNIFYVLILFLFVFECMLFVNRLSYLDYKTDYWLNDYLNTVSYMANSKAERESFCELLHCEEKCGENSEVLNYFKYDITTFVETAFSDEIEIHMRSKPSLNRRKITQNPLFLIFEDGRMSDEESRCRLNEQSIGIMVDGNSEISKREASDDLGIKQQETVNHENVHDVITSTFPDITENILIDQCKIDESITHENSLTVYSQYHLETERHVIGLYENSSSVSDDVMSSIDAKIVEKFNSVSSIKEFVQNKEHIIHIQSDSDDIITNKILTDSEQCEIGIKRHCSNLPVNTEIKFKEFQNFKQLIKNNSVYYNFFYFSLLLCILTICLACSLLISLSSYIFYHRKTKCKSSHVLEGRKDFQSSIRRNNGKECDTERKYRGEQVENNKNHEEFLTEKMLELNSDEDDGLENMKKTINKKVSKAGSNKEKIMIRMEMNLEKNKKSCETKPTDESLEPHIFQENTDLKARQNANYKYGHSSIERNDKRDDSEIKQDTSQSNNTIKNNLGIYLECLMRKKKTMFYVLLLFILTGSIYFLSFLYFKTEFFQEIRDKKSVVEITENEKKVSNEDLKWAEFRDLSSDVSSISYENDVSYLFNFKEEADSQWHLETIRRKIPLYKDGLVIDDVIDNSDDKILSLINRVIDKCSYGMICNYRFLLNMDELFIVVQTEDNFNTESDSTYSDFLLFSVLGFLILNYSYTFLIGLIRVSYTFIQKYISKQSITSDSESYYFNLEGVENSQFIFPKMNTEPNMKQNTQADSKCGLKKVFSENNVDVNSFSSSYTVENERIDDEILNSHRVSTNLYDSIWRKKEEVNISFDSKNELHAGEIRDNLEVDEFFKSENEKSDYVFLAHYNNNNNESNNFETVFPSNDAIETVHRISSTHGIHRLIDQNERKDYENRPGNSAEGNGDQGIHSQNNEAISVPVNLNYGTEITKEGINKSKDCNSEENFNADAVTQEKKVQETRLTHPNVWQIKEIQPGNSGEKGNGDQGIISHNEVITDSVLPNVCTDITKEGINKNNDSNSKGNSNGGMLTQDKKVLETERIDPNIKQNEGSEFGNSSEERNIDRGTLSQNNGVVTAFENPKFVTKISKEGVNISKDYNTEDNSNVEAVIQEEKVHKTRLTDPNVSSDEEIQPSNSAEKGNGGVGNYLLKNMTATPENESHETMNENTNYTKKESRDQALNTSELKFPERKQDENMVEKFQNKTGSDYAGALLTEKSSSLEHEPKNTTKNKKSRIHKNFESAISSEKLKNPENSMQNDAVPKQLESIIQHSAFEKGNVNASDLQKRRKRNRQSREMPLVYSSEDAGAKQSTRHQEAMSASGRDYGRMNRKQAGDVILFQQGDIRFQFAVKEDADYKFSFSTVPQLDASGRLEYFKYDLNLEKKSSNPLEN